MSKGRTPFSSVWINRPWGIDQRHCSPPSLRRRHLLHRHPHQRRTQHLALILIAGAQHRDDVTALYLVARLAGNRLVACRVKSRWRRSSVTPCSPSKIQQLSLYLSKAIDPSELIHVRLPRPPPHQQTAHAQKPDRNRPKIGSIRRTSSPFGALDCLGQLALLASAAVLKLCRRTLQPDPSTPAPGLAPGQAPPAKRRSALRQKVLPLPPPPLPPRRRLGAAGRLVASGCSSGAASFTGNLRFRLLRYASFAHCCFLVPYPNAQ